MLILAMRLDDIAQPAPFGHVKGARCPFQAMTQQPDDPLTSPVQGFLDWFLLPVSVMLRTPRPKLPYIEEFSVAGKMSMRFDGKTLLAGLDIVPKADRDLSEAFSVVGCFPPVNGHSPPARIEALFEILRRKWLHSHPTNSVRHFGAARRRTIPPVTRLGSCLKMVCFYLITI